MKIIEHRFFFIDKYWSIIEFTTSFLIDDVLLVPDIDIDLKFIFKEPIEWCMYVFTYRIRVNRTPSWIEPQETYFGQTTVSAQIEQRGSIKFLDF